MAQVDKGIKEHHGDIGDEPFLFETHVVLRVKVLDRRDPIRGNGHFPLYKQLQRSPRPLVLCVGTLLQKR